MNTFNPYHIARIIIRVRLRVASCEEREILHQWLDASEENRQLFKEIIRGNSIRGRLKTEDEINRTADYSRVYQELLKNIRQKKREKRSIGLWSGVAAACIGMLFCFFPTRTVVEISPVMELAALTEQDSAESKIMLILGDGKELDLERIDKTMIPDDSHLSLDSAGKLLYKTDTRVYKDPVYHTIKTRTGGFYTLLLSDGTRIWLNSKTILRYPAVFAGEERRVYLEGEAYFEVAADPSRPFWVETSDTRTRVLGTSFNINAYRDEKSTYTTLVSGEVEVSAANIPWKKITLKPEMQSSWDYDKKEFGIREVVSEDIISWTNGEFVFKEDDIGVVTRMLSRWYDVTFKYEEEKVGHHTYSGKMSKEDDLELILEILTLAGGPEFNLKNDTVYVKEN